LDDNLILMYKSIITALFLFLVASCRSRFPRTGTIASSYDLGSEKDLDPLIAEAGRARIVVLGESSHGTAEYYFWRAAITRRLIEEKGFRLIAVEGDWSEMKRIDSFIHEGPADSLAATGVLRQNSRWPLWLWSNSETAGLVAWLNRHNQTAREKCSFYGLDLFSISASAATIKNSSHDSAARRAAGVLLQCFAAYGNDALTYAGHYSDTMNCRQEAEQLWTASQRAARMGSAAENFLLLQNAAVVRNGERYFARLPSDRTASWNIREGHMLETLQRILSLQGKKTKLIVWVHNTHAGDAHYVETAQGKTSLGEMLRREYGPSVFIVGFGSYQGYVTASESWGGQMKQMELPAAKQNSWEEKLHRQSDKNRLLIFRPVRRQGGGLEWTPQRAVGVVYRTSSDEQVYVSSVVAWRYDAFLFIDKTHALDPLE
jgi:erythromycin esterase